MLYIAYFQCKHLSYRIVCEEQLAKYLHQSESRRRDIKEDYVILCYDDLITLHWWGVAWPGLWVRPARLVGKGFAKELCIPIQAHAD